VPRLLQLYLPWLVPFESSV
jgi:hypothetical protein